MELYLNTPGTYLHVKDQLFEVKVKKDGVEQKHHFAAKKIKTIILATRAALSTDAVQLALMHNVDIVFVQHDGHPFGRVWHSKLGSTTKIRKRQLEVSLNREGLTIVKDLIARKITNQLDFLKDLKKHRAKQAETIEESTKRLDSYLAKLQALEADHVAEVADTIRGLEGSAGREYFGKLSQLLTQEHQFKGRSFRPAADPFNAFLNYAYGMLYSKVEKCLMIAGLDPYVGMLHRDDYNQVSFVFDFIEPYRIHADRVVYRLFTGKLVNKSHTDEITNGCSLNKAGKELLVGKFNPYMEEEKIRHNNRNLTRTHAMQLDAHQLANELIK